MQKIGKSPVLSADEQDKSWLVENTFGFAVSDDTLTRNVFDAVSSNDLRGPEAMVAASDAPTFAPPLALDTASDLATQPSDFVTTGGKWGSSATLGTAGGVVTWSVVGSGLTNQTGANFFTGSTVFMDTVFADFKNQLAYAFNAWSKVANIQFVEVSDGGGDFGVGTTANIRIGAGFIDGNVGSNVLARAFFPGAGTAGAVATHGDMIFDSGNVWNTQLFFLTAVHELGHSLGLNHETINTAIMNPFINTSLTGLQTDDINGIRAIYGTGSVSDAWANDTSTVGDVRAGSWTTGTIGFTGDHDWVRVDLVAGQTYLFGLKGSSGTPLSDPRMSLYSSSSNSLATNDDGGVGLNSRIFYTATTTGAHYVDAYSFMNNVSGQNYTVSAQRMIYGAADIDNNGRDDVIWEDYSNGLTGAYLNGANGLPQLWAALGTIDPAYYAAGFGDFNGDGYSDILWRSTQDNSTGFFQSNGVGGFGWVGYGALADGYSIAGIGDYNADGRSDILWRNLDTGDTGWYRNTALGFSWAGLGAVPSNYSVVGIDDFSGDGLDDILWQDSTGGIGYYRMSAVGGAAWVGYGVSTNTVIGTGDFDGNGSADILWRNTATGEVGYWQTIAGLHGNTQSYGFPSSNYQVVAVGDYNGNGVDDVMWRDVNTGVTGYYSNAFGGGVSFVYYSTTPGNWDLL